VRHITARVEPSDLATIHSLEKAAFEMIEGIQTFTLALRSHVPARPPIFETRLFVPNDLEQVLAIARSAYVYDRFHADAALSKETADTANEVWVRNACLGRTADAVVVVREAGTVLGYATCKVDAEAADCLGVSLGSISTVAVAAQAQRRGVGRSAILAALDWFRQHRVEAVDAGIQLQNIPAARLYERCGFQQADISLTFRKLIRKTENKAPSC
jgi:ribosomal protein S18 acetylase RimI-like enzyme